MSPKPEKREENSLDLSVSTSVDSANMQETSESKSTAKFTPTDEQQAIIDAKPGEILVSASAGTGKTGVMTERLVKRILDGEIGLNQVLVLTFTDAASLEMKDRIRRLLDEKIETHPEKKQQLLQQRRQLQQAQISTLHAFCLRVIREFKHLLKDGNKALTSAELTPLDPEVADEMLEEAVDDVLEATYLLLAEEENFGEYGTREGLWLLMDTLGNGKSDEALRETLKSFYLDLQAYPNFNDVIDQAVLDAKTIANQLWTKQLARRVIEDLRPEVERVRWALPTLKAWYPMIKIVKNKKDNAERHASIAQVIEATEVFLRRYDHLVDFAKAEDEDHATAIDTFEIDSWDVWVKTVNALLQADDDLTLKKRSSDPEQSSFINFYYETIRKLCTRFKKGGKGKTVLFRRPQAEIQAELQAMLPAIFCFAELLRQVDQRYSQKKRRMGVIDFSDFEHFALQILEEEEAQRYYKERFKEIYVDEYQDTSVIQELILEHLGVKNIFRVGDVKQSIYRFRQAEPKLFLDKLHAYQKGKGGSLYTLSKNFRSKPEILAVVNRIFIHLMREEVTQIEYQGLHELRPGKDVPCEGPRLFLSILLTDDKYKNDESINTYTQREANDYILLQDIQALHQAGVPWGDLCIMARKHDPLQRIIPFLDEARIPYSYSEAKQGELISAEQRRLEALIQVLDNPRQDRPLAAVLLSSFVPETWTETELLELRLSRDEKDAFFHELVLDENLVGHPFQAKLANFRIWLTELRKPLGDGGLVQRFAELFQDSGFQHLCALHNKADVQALPEHFLRFLEDHPRLQSFRDLAMLIEDDDHLDLSDAQEPDRSVLQLVTFHGSKGLQYPYIFLMDCDANIMSYRPTTPLHYDEDLGFTLKYMDAQKPIKRDNLLDQLIKSKEYRDDLAEETRLFYVALTRAEEKIFVYARAKTKKFFKQLEERQAWFQVQDFCPIDRTELHRYYELDKIRSSTSYFHFLNMGLTDQSREHLAQILSESIDEPVEGNLSDLVKLRLTPMNVPIEEAPNMSPFRGTEIVDMGPLLGPRTQVKEEDPIIKDIDEKSYFLQQGGGEIDPWYEALFAEEKRDKFSENLDLKYSVSELQRQAEERYETEERIIWQAINRQQHKLDDVKLNAREPSRLRGAERGSAIHKVVRYLDWKALREAWEAQGTNGGIAAYQKQLELMVKAQMIEPLVQETAKPLAPQMMKLVGHNIGYKIAHTRVLQEQPFTLRILADELYPEANTELHVQGVLDLAWFEEDGAGLLDFKTDHLWGTKDQMRQELERRYTRQLNYYALALERSGLTNRVKTKVIFLVDQGELFFF